MTYLPTSTLLVAAIGLLACGGEQTAEAPAAPSDAITTQGVSVTPKVSGTDFPDAHLTNFAYEDGTFTYGYEADTYQLGAQTPDAASTMCANSAKGQHIHLIVDNEPYIAKYEPTFEQEIADGQHRILTFLSRSYHESIKSPQAHRAVMADVSDGAFASQEPITEPMLFYSRPKGTYVGKDAESVLLDFYPVNVELGADYAVKVEVGGFTTTLDAWQPYVIEGLPMGENTVTLTLVDGEGKRVEAPLNPVSRSFTLQADPMPGE